MDVPNAAEMNKFYYQSIRENINVNISISSMKIKICGPWELFMTPCYLECKENLFVSFRIEGLNIFATTLPDSRCLAPAAWRHKFIFCLLGYSLHPFEVPYFIAVIGIHFISNLSHPVDLWTSQIAY
jgi:hypothetical protein